MRAKCLVQPGNVATTGFPYREQNRLRPRLLEFVEIIQHINLQSFGGIGSLMSPKHFFQNDTLAAADRGRWRTSERAVTA